MQKAKWGDHIALQLLNLLFSFSSVLVKYASLSAEQNGWLDGKTLGLLFFYVLLLGLYAVFWQLIIKRIPLSAAYLSKGLLIVWLLVWSVVFFSESITVFNLAGTGVIAVGIVLVSIDG